MLGVLSSVWLEPRSTLSAPSTSQELLELRAPLMEKGMVAVWPGRQRDADVQLVDRSRRDAGHQGHQLFVIARHQREFAHLRAVDHRALLARLQLHLNGELQRQ